MNLIVKWYQMRKLMLVEEGLQNFIETLKKRKIPVYGLCTMQIQIQNIEPKRFLELFHCPRLANLEAKISTISNYLKI